MFKQLIFVIEQTKRSPPLAGGAGETLATYCCQAFVRKLTPSFIPWASHSSGRYDPSSLVGADDG